MDTKTVSHQPRVLLHGYQLFVGVSNVIVFLSPFLKLLQLIFVQIQL